MPPQDFIRGLSDENSGIKMNISTNKKDIQSGYRDYMGGQEPELYERYRVIEKRYSGHKAKHPYHYFLVPDTPKYQNLKLKL